MKYFTHFLLIVLFFSACKSEPVHPLYGEWKLNYVNDSLVFDNPDEIRMEFSEDGTIKTIGNGQESVGEYILSKDTSQITIMEEGKVITEYKIKSLTNEELVIEEGFDIIRFKKMEH